MKYSSSLPGVKEAKTKNCIIRWAVLWTKYIRAELKSPSSCPAKREMVKEVFREEVTFVQAIKEQRDRARSLMEMKKVWARPKMDKNRACLENGKDVWRDQNRVGPASEQQEMALERGSRPRAQGLECRSSWMIGLYSVGHIIPNKVYGQKRTPLYLGQMISTARRQLDWKQESWRGGGVMAWTRTMDTRKGSCLQRLSQHTHHFQIHGSVSEWGSSGVLCLIHPVPTTAHKANLKMNFSVQKGEQMTFESLEILASL